MNFTLRNSKAYTYTAKELALTFFRCCCCSIYKNNIRFVPFLLHAVWNCSFFCYLLRFHRKCSECITIILELNGKRRETKKKEIDFYIERWYFTTFPFSVCVVILTVTLWLSALSWFMFFFFVFFSPPFVWEAVKKFHFCLLNEKFSFSNHFIWMILMAATANNAVELKKGNKRNQSDHCYMGHPCTWIKDTQSAPLPQRCYIKKRMNNNDNDGDDGGGGGGGGSDDDDGGRLNSSDTNRIVWVLLS